MIPLRDNIRSRTTPVVNYALIAVSAAVFLLQLTRPDLIERYGMIPARISDPGREVMIEDIGVRQTPSGEELVRVRRPAEPSAVPPLLTLLTCVFLHGGWLHVIGNLWFLYVFGDNVEDRFGHLEYLLLYLAGGVAASLAHYAVNSGSTVPTIGASGAVACVMGAYLVLYPHARVFSIVPIIIVFFAVRLPAPLFLGFWFLIQLFQGAFAIRSAAQTGVAWWAHIGGFAAGAAVAWVTQGTLFQRPPASEEREAPANGRYHFR